MTLPHKYPVTEDVARDLNNRFTYHPPFGDQADRYGELRGAALHFAMTVTQNVPAGRERSLALTYIQLAVMLANAAIACNEAPPAPVDPIPPTTAA